MKDIRWLDNGTIRVDPPKRTKKVTGTRFASILGKNVWSTPFEMWCAITKTYEEPFTDTIYTIAGKTIEPKQIEYVKRSYGMDVVTPADVYGEDFFNKTHGDFFKDNKVTGGMWDALYKDDETGEVAGVLEMKTTKRAEDWKDDIPEYYALQAALYAYLLGVDDVIMVASFLEDSDYKNPETFIPTIENTITVPFKVSERYPNFKDMVKEVTKWWERHVVTGVSPKYDEKKDAEILKALRTTTLNPDSDITEILKEAETLKVEIDEYNKKYADKVKRLDNLTKQIKEYATGQFTEGDKKVELQGNFKWTLSKSESVGVDKEKLEKDGLFDKYKKVSTSYRLTVK